MEPLVWTLLMVILFASIWMDVVKMTTTNVALFKPTRQVDTSVGTSSRAVDGNSSPTWIQESCTRTTSESDTWWAVDLLSTYEVSTIQIVNRKYFPRRLRNFIIYVSTVNPLPIPPASNQPFSGDVCLNSTDVLLTGRHTLNCVQPVTGRYVYLWKPNDNTLSICEFEVIVLGSEVREMMCINIGPGSKSLMTPTSSLTLTKRRRSLGYCMNICMLHITNVPTHVQLNRKSGECECIQYSDLVNDSPHVISPDEDFDLCFMS